MKELVDWIAGVASELHPAQLEALSDALIASPAKSALIAFRQCAGAFLNASLCASGLNLLTESPAVATAELAGMLHAAAATARIYNSRVDLKLAWTGPSTMLIPVRRTEQVLSELIDFAKEELFIISYVFFAVPSVAASLQNAVSRGVKIRALFDRSIECGGSLDFPDPVNNARRILPTLEYYAWNQGAGGGAMHVKCAVADRPVAFITSANLTGAAMEKNMELGILIKGGPVPADLRAHFSALVDTREIHRI